MMGDLQLFGIGLVGESLQRLSKFWTLKRSGCVYVSGSGNRVIIRVHTLLRNLSSAMELFRIPLCPQGNPTYQKRPAN